MPPADQEMKESSSMNFDSNDDSDPGDVKYYEYLMDLAGPTFPLPNAATHQRIKEAEAVV